MNADYDALIIGGGPAGATAAILLARAGWLVAVVEQKTFPRAKVCGEYLSATNLPLLRELGIADRFQADGGPEIRRVGLFAGKSIIEAPLSRPVDRSERWGRAWARAVLDTCLLNQAAAAGAQVFQPCTVTRLRTCAERHVCEVQGPVRAAQELSASVVIAAHGSWLPGTLPTQLSRRPPLPVDLLGFKAHFRGHELRSDLMPLVCLPGGYGGMVNCGNDCLSFSLCIRRDQLAQIRRGGGEEVGDSALRHVEDNCGGVRSVLRRAERIGRWLAAGPIQPGIRLPRRDGCFAVGNAAGEAHPVVAEGISMAMQSAWLLAKLLNEWRTQGGDRSRSPALQEQYARLWRRAFAPRIRAAAVIAHWAMRPFAVRTLAPILRAWPQLLTVASRWSGKATVVTSRAESAVAISESSPVPEESNA